MYHIHDHLVSMYRDSGCCGSSSFIRTETPTSSDMNLSVTNHLNPVIINVPDSFELERFSSDTLYWKTSPNESSFDGLLSKKALEAIVYPILFMLPL